MTDATPARPSRRAAPSSAVAAGGALWRQRGCAQVRLRTDGWRSFARRGNSQLKLRLKPRAAAQPPPGTELRGEHGTQRRSSAPVSHQPSARSALQVPVGRAVDARPTPRAHAAPLQGCLLYAQSALRQEPACLCASPPKRLSISR